MDNYILIVDFVSKIITIIAGTMASFLGILTFIYRNSIFKSSLRNKQLNELENIRYKLHQVWFDLYYVKILSDQMTSLGCSINDIKTTQPEDWEQYTRFKNNCLELFYKLSFKEYYLLPRWIDYDKISEIYIEFERLLPFTLIKMAEFNREIIKDKMNNFLKTINYLDSELKKRS